MTLQETAAAVGESPRWVLNALTRLKVPRRYSEPLARRLYIARLLNRGLRLPLPDAWHLAADVLAGNLTEPWRHEADGLSLQIDVPRVLTGYAARLALARHQGPRARGRRRSTFGSAVERAAQWGIDVSLLEAMLDLPPRRRTASAVANMTWAAANRERALRERSRDS